MQSSKATNKNRAHKTLIYMRAYSKLSPKRILSNISFRRSSQTSNFNFGSRADTPWKKETKESMLCFGKHTYSPKNQHRTFQKKQHRCKCCTAASAAAAVTVVQRRTKWVLEDYYLPCCRQNPLSLKRTQLIIYCRRNITASCIVCVAVRSRREKRGFGFRGCIHFLCSPVPRHYLIQRIDFISGNLYLWTKKKTQTSIRIHCIAKQSISLYSAAVEFDTMRFVSFRFDSISIQALWIPLSWTYNCSHRLIFIENFHSKNFARAHSARFLRLKWYFSDIKFQ